MGSSGVWHAGVPEFPSAYLRGGLGFRGLGFRGSGLWVLGFGLRAWMAFWAVGLAQVFWASGLCV